MRLPAQPWRINLLNDQGLQPGGKYPNPEQLAAITFLTQSLPDLTQDQIDYYELADTEQSEIAVYAKNGPRYLFDYKDNLQDTVDKLHLLLTSIAPKDLKNLYYVDMTIDNRGYVCLKGTPCAGTQPVLGSSTSTATSTLDNIKQP